MKRFLVVLGLILGSLLIMDYGRLEGDLAWLRSCIYKSPGGMYIADLKVKIFGSNSAYIDHPKEILPSDSSSAAIKDEPPVLMDDGEGKIENLAVIVPSCD